MLCVGTNCPHRVLPSILYRPPCIVQNVIVTFICPIGPIRPIHSIVGFVLASAHDAFKDGSASIYLKSNE